MEKTRTERFEEMLSKLRTINPDIEGVGIVSDEGLIIASVMPAEVDEDVLTAMSGTILTLGERVVRELNRGELEQIYIRGRSGYAVASQAGPNGVLIALAQNTAKLGMLFLDIRRTANEVAQIL